MTTVVMPQPGQSVTEGTIVRWLKQVGETVALDEVLVEIETEKVNVEVPSPVEGTITAILVQEGETVPVGAELIVIGEPGMAGSEVLPMSAETATDAAAGGQADTATATADAAAAPISPVTSPVAARQSTDGEQAPTPATAGAEAAREAAVVPAAAAAVDESPPAGTTTAPNGRQSGGDGAGRFTPAVLRLAAEHGLDLAAIPGTGMGGRVTRKDVQQFLDRGPAPATASAAATAPPAAEAAPVAMNAPVAEMAPPEASSPATGGGRAGMAEERTLAATFTPPGRAPDAEAATSREPAADRAAPAAPAPARTATFAGEDEEIVQPSRTRLTIARNMLKVAQEVPVAWMVVETDLTGLVRLRDRHKEAFRQGEGVDLSYLPFVVQAVAGALKAHPLLNSEWRDDQIVLKKRVNLGIAVGVEEGLIVPVIHDADRLSLTGIAHAIADLAARARSRKLKFEDIDGGTFTVDNTGVFGSLVSQPIINPGQAAILSTEAIVKRPVVRDDAIAIRSLMNLCISFDHRVLDGTDIGPFMQTVKSRLEALNPDSPLT